MTPQELRDRTMRFAVDVASFAAGAGAGLASDATRQLVRAASSVGANYRASNRARSHPEFRAKIGLVLEEADESLYWLEFLQRAGGPAGPELQRLLREAEELTRIFSAALATAKRNGRAADDRANRLKRGR